MIEELDALIFVDTNILLDFYRIRKSDVSLEYLQRLEECSDRLIIGSQIEMEYKKNRQKVILESLKQFSSPDWGKLTTPALVADLKATMMIEKKKLEISHQQKKINSKIEKILHNPAGNDPVYQKLQRIFKKSSVYNLDRSSKKRIGIRNKAKKRFILGYPPRKENDTSIGDAINWEWLIECAISSGKDIIIVTRDGDYGTFYKNKSYLNDWLQLEFKERVSRKRKLILTDRLSVALKMIDAVVTEEMEIAELQMMTKLLEETVTHMEKSLSEIDEIFKSCQ